MEKRRVFFKNISVKKKVIILLGIMIVAQLAVITYTFGWRRQGYHSDENWQYGFANAYYEHQICVDDDGNIKNFNEWKDGQVLRNYLEVQKGQQFRFDSVAYNMRVDLSPPLSSMLLHAVCSLFPDTFSWWYAYLINVVFFVITMIALYFLGKELFHSRKKALFSCLWYGFATAALNCFVFLRMYSMLTAFSVLLTYFYCRAYNKKFQRVMPELIAIALITFLGGMTHYYFYLLAFFMTGAFVLYQLFTKHFKTMVINAVLQLGAVGLAFFIWPVTIGKAQSGPSLYGAQLKMPYLFELEMSVNNIVGDTTGISVSFPSIVTWTYLWIGAIFVAIIFGGVSFVFRHEEKYWNFWKQLVKSVLSFFKNLPKTVKNSNKSVFFIAFAMDASVLVIARLSNIFLMGRYADRYYFYLMPFFIVLLVYVVDWILTVFLKRGGRRHQEKILCLITLVCIVLNHIFYPCGYLIPTASDVSLPELTKGSNVVMVLNDKWQLTTFSSLVRDCDQFLAILAEDVMSEEAMKSINEMPSSSEESLLLIEKDMLMPEDETYSLFGAEFDESAMKQRFLEYKESEVLEKIKGLSSIVSIEQVDEMRILQRKLGVYRMKRGNVE